MEIDAGSILYQVLDKLGRKQIEAEIASSPSAAGVIRRIFLTAITALGSYEYDKAKIHNELVVALMHYLLTASMIQTERKVEYEHGLMLDIVIPSVRNLRADAKRTLLLAFPQTDVEGRVSSLQRAQPVKENIWLVFGHYSDDLTNSCKGFRTYVPDDLAGETLRPLSLIMDDIKSFLETNKIKSFKIFPS